VVADRPCRNCGVRRSPLDPSQTLNAQKPSQPHAYSSLHQSLDDGEPNS
jgi:hypothetical protein